MVSPLLGTTCASYYFEWHLEQPIQTDLLVSVEYRYRKELIKLLADAKVTRQDHRWKEIVHFLRSWDHFSTTRTIRVPHIWMAFDYDHLHTSFMPPNLHFCIDRHFIERENFPDYRNIVSERLFTAILNTFSGNIFPPFPVSSVSLLRKCFRVLKNDGEVLHFSFMLHRTPPVFKLNVTMPRMQLIELLYSMGWRGNGAALEKLCKRFAPKSRRIKANICIEESLCSRIEIELEYNRPLEKNRQRDTMLSRLLQSEMITRQQHHDLTNWSGRSFPENKSGASPITAERWLDMKLCLDEKGETSVKAYLGFASAPKISW